MFTIVCFAHICSNNFKNHTDKTNIQNNPHKQITYTEYVKQNILNIYKY